MITLVGEVCGYSFYAPYEVSKSVRSIEAHMPCHGSEKADVGMPWMRDRAVLIFRQKTIYRRAINAWEGIRQVNDHPESVRIEGLIANAGLIELLYVCDSAYTAYVVLNDIADWQPFGIGAVNAPLDVRAGG